MRKAVSNHRLPTQLDVIRLITSIDKTNIFYYNNIVIKRKIEVIKIEKQERTSSTENNMRKKIGRTLQTDRKNFISN